MTTAVWFLVVAGVVALGRGQAFLRAVRIVVSFLVGPDGVRVFR
jgi:hypothetical protein